MADTGVTTAGKMSNALTASHQYGYLPCFQLSAAVSSQANRCVRIWGMNAANSKQDTARTTRSVRSIRHARCRVSKLTTRKTSAPARMGSPTACRTPLVLLLNTRPARAAIAPARRFHGLARVDAPLVTHQADRPAARANARVGLIWRGIFPAEAAALVATAAPWTTVLVSRTEPRSPGSIFSADTLHSWNICWTARSSFGASSIRPPSAATGTALTCCCSRWPRCRSWPARQSRAVRRGRWRPAASGPAPWR